MGRRAWLVALVVLSACGGHQQLQAPGQAPLVPQVELPPYTAAIPALRLQMRGPVGKKALTVIERTPGVVVAAPFATDRVKVFHRGETTEIDVVSVEPLSFRPVAPGPTRDADFVWTALIGGRAVLAPETARNLDFGDGGVLRMAGRDISVGAFADNALPNVGDVMISDDTAKIAPVGRPDEVIVGVREGADVQRLGRSLKRALGSRVSNVKRLQPEADLVAQTAASVGTAQGELIGSMDYRILKGGYIEPDPAWVAANIATGSVPLLGSVTCHRALFPQLVAALDEIQREGLARHIDPGDFGGCYAPRFIDRDPRRGLSFHAFGLAIDLNVSRNQLGTKGDMDRRIVAIFEKWGFAWGGSWTRPDPMHFELARLVDV